MQIRFVFTSDRLENARHVHNVLATLRLHWNRDTNHGVLPVIDVDADRVLQIAIAIHQAESDRAADALQIVTDLAEVLARIASQFGVTWHVGHEHDAHIGSIAAGVPADDVIDELRTAVNVARSLADLIVDDEFVEPDSFLLGSDDFDEQDVDQDEDCSAEASWDDLFQPPESFIRFREFD